MRQKTTALDHALQLERGIWEPGFAGLQPRIIRSLTRSNWAGQCAHADHQPGFPETAKRAPEISAVYPDSGA